MSQVSKYPISKEVYETIFGIFLGTIADLKTKTQVSEFFKEFLTPTERIMFAKRLAIAVLLAKNYRYREISKILRVSATTIGGISLQYKYGDNFKRMISHVLESEKSEKFWLEFSEKVSGILSSGGSKSGGWFYLKQELRKKRLKKAF